MCKSCPYRKKCRKTNGYKHTRHHFWHPRQWYNTKLEIAFRNHPLNSIDICRYKHDILHLLMQPPPKPSVKTMTDFLNKHPV